MKLWEIINNTMNSQHYGSNHFNKNSTSKNLKKLLSTFLLFWKCKLPFSEALIYCCLLQFNQKFPRARSQFWRVPSPHGQVDVWWVWKQHSACLSWLTTVIGTWQRDQNYFFWRVGFCYVRQYRSCSAPSTLAASWVQSELLLEHWRQHMAVSYLTLLQSFDDSQMESHVGCAVNNLSLEVMKV